MFKRSFWTFLVFAMVLYGAQEEGYTHKQRVLDMQKMAQAMQDIQTGFFYNNADIVHAGASDLKKLIQKVGPTIEEMRNKDIYEQYLLNGEKMTHKIKTRIQNRAQDIIDRFKDNDAVQALQAYTSITKQCMKCHIRLRKW